MSNISLAERMGSQNNFILFSEGERADEDKASIAERMNSADIVFTRNDGGPGSGNFGHEGRPGEIGGSAPSDESKAKDGFSKKEQKIVDAMKFKDGSGSAYKNLESAAEVNDGKKNYHEARFKDGRVIQSHSFSSMKEVLKDLKKNADDDGKMGDMSVWIKYRNGTEVSYKAGDAIMDMKTSDIASALVKQGKTQYGFNTEYDLSESAPKAQEEKQEPPKKEIPDYHQFGATHAERKEYRNKMFEEYRTEMEAYRPTLTELGQIRKEKREAVSKVQAQLNSYYMLKGVTDENREEELKKAKAEADKALEDYQDYFAFSDEETKKKDALWYKFLSAQERMHAIEQFDVLKPQMDELEKKLVPLKKELDDAEKDYQKAYDHASEIVGRYNDRVAEVNAAILKKYPSYDSIHSSDDAAEYLTAKGYFRKHGMYNPNNYSAVENEPTGSSSGAVSLDSMNEQVARHACETVDRVFDKFPEFAGFVRFFGTDDYLQKGSAGEYKSGAVTFDKKFFGETDESEWGGSYHPKIVSKDGVPKYHNQTVAHELGHALDDFLCLKNPDLVDNLYYGKSGSWTTYYDTIGSKLLSRAAKNLGMTQTALKQKISGYACKNSVEAFAEAFSEYIASDEPRPFIMEIGRQIESVYRTGKLAGKVN